MINRKLKPSSTSYSSDNVGVSEAELPPLIPDPLVPPTSIDSPPRFYSATLPPPRTKTHAASTQTLNKRKYAETLKYRQRSKDHFKTHFYTSSSRTSAKSTPRRNVSTSTSPITLDPSFLSLIDKKNIDSVKCSSLVSPIRSNKVSTKEKLEDEAEIIESTHKIVQDVYTDNGGKSSNVYSANINYQDFHKDNDAHILTKGLVYEAKDSATSPTIKEDLLNKIGKKIRFRKKKREKVKTENRARKALKTISLILGAFVTCWTPYHILAIIASFCPACVNIHIYMLSYFLCYANRSVIYYTSELKVTNLSVFSPINPFCYAASNQQFKNAFRRIIKGDLSFK